MSAAYLGLMLLLVLETSLAPVASPSPLSGASPDFPSGEGGPPVPSVQETRHSPTFLPSDASTSWLPPPLQSSAVNSGPSPFIQVTSLGLQGQPINVADEVPSPYVYVVNSGSNNVSVFSGSTVVANLTVGFSPQAAAYDPANGLLYVANENSNNLTEINGTHVLGNVTLQGGAPFALAYDASLRAMAVGIVGLGQVDFVNSSGLFANTTVYGKPLGLAYDPANSYLYVSNGEAGGNLTVLNATGKQVGNISLGPQDTPGGLAYDSADQEVYLTNAQYGTGDNVTVISGLRTVASVTVGRFPTAAAFDPTNGDVYVTNYGSTNVSVLSGTSVIANVSVPIYSDGLGVDPSNGEVYVADPVANLVTEIQGTRVIGKLTSFLNSGLGPIDQTWDAANGDLYVSDRVSGTVSVINGTSVVATIPVDPDPGAITYDNADQDVLVIAGGRVDVISGFSVIARVGVGSFPRGIAFDALDSDVYVTNFYSNNVTVIHGTSAVSSLPVGRWPTSDCYDPQDGDVYVAGDFQNNVTVIQNLTSIASVPVGLAPWQSSYDPQDGDVYIVNNASQNISVLRGTQVVGTIGSTNGLGIGPSGMGFDPVARDLGVTDHYSNDLSLILGTTVLRRVVVGWGPVGVSYSPTQERAYVANGWSNNLSLVQPQLGLEAPTAQPSSGEPGAPDAFSVVSGGSSGSVRYTWTGLPPGCGPTTQANLSCRVAGAPNETYRIVVEAVDGAGHRATSPPLYFRVGASFLATGPFAQPSPLREGSPGYITGSVRGGVAPYRVSFGGLPGCPSADVLALPCTPSAAGTFNVTMSVEDALGAWANTTASLVVVAPTAPITATWGTPPPWALDLGENLSASVRASGGIGGLNFTWTGLPLGCPNSWTATLTCHPTGGAGTSFLLSVNVTDGSGDSTTVGPSGVMIFSAPRVSALTVRPSNATNGTTVVVTTLASGGAGPLDFAYTGLPPPCLSQNLSTFSCTPDRPGSYRVGVTVTDALGAVAEAAVPLVVSTTAGPSRSTGTSSSPLLAFLESEALPMAIVGTAIAVGVAVMLWRRKKSLPATGGASNHPADPPRDPSQPVEAEEEGALSSKGARSEPKGSDAVGPDAERPSHPSPPP